MARAEGTNLNKSNDLVDQPHCKQFPAASFPRHGPQDIPLSDAHQTVVEIEQNNPVSHDGTSSYDMTGHERTLESLHLG